MKHLALKASSGIALLVLMSASPLAGADLRVNLGIGLPYYAEPPPVYYAPPPRYYSPPPPVYYGPSVIYEHRDDDDRHHDRGRHRGHHRDRDDDRR